MKILLKDYLEENPEEESTIAEVFYKTDCFMFAEKKIINEVEKYFLKKDELEDVICFDFNKLYLMKENSSYLIYEIEDIIDNEYDFLDFNEEVILKLRNKKQVIIIWAIYSYERCKGYASKNIDRLVEYSKIRKLNIVVDTFTKELIRLALKKGLLVLRKEALLNN